jgi:tricorn protease-like protein
MLSNAVFISYRRSVSAELAYMLYLGLQGRNIDPFYDYESIQAGRWLDIILRQIAARPYFLLVLAPGALNRCVDASDILRQEIQQAVDKQRLIIPLYTHDFKWEDCAKYLPAALATAIHSHQGVEWPVQRNYYDDAFDRLQEYLVKIDLNLEAVPHSDKDLLRENRAKLESIPPKSAPATGETAAASPRQRLRWIGLAAMVFVLALIGVVIISNRSAEGVAQSPTPVPQVTTGVAQAVTQAAPATTIATAPTNIAQSATRTPTYTPTLLPPFVGHRDSIQSVAYSPDGKFIASGSNDDSIRIWDAATGKVLHTLTGFVGAIWTVTYSPDGKFIASAGVDGAVRIWEAETGLPSAVLSGHTGAVWDVAYSPNGKFIASAGSDKTVRLWDAASGAIVRIFTEHTNGVHGVAYSPDGKFIASGSYDKTVVIRNTETGSVLHTLTGHTYHVYDVAYSPDGKFIASASADRTARIWDTTTGVQVHTLTGHTNYVFSVAYRPDGQFIVTGSSDYRARVWEAATGKSIYTMTQHKDFVTSVVFSPDGKLIASGSFDDTIRVWVMPPFLPTPTPAATR